MPENIVPFHTRERSSKQFFVTDEEVELLAMAISSGMNNKQIAEICGCSTATVSIGKRDARVRAVVMKFVEDRVIRVTRKVDSVIEERLQHAHELTIDELLKVRKEYLGGALRMQTQGGDARDVATINEAMDTIEGDPTFAKELRELLANKDNDKQK